MSAVTWVVVIAYNGADHLPRVLESWHRHGEGSVLAVVDNASADGSAELVGRLAPAAVLLRQERNLGFAGGANAGLRAALAAGAEHVLLLNQDAELCAGTLAGLAAFMEARADAAAVQPTILLPDGRCNSLGNPYHYLGFTVAGGNGLPLDEAARRLPWVHGPRVHAGGEAAVRIPACSGTAMYLRVAALRHVGLLEEELFLYHEDLELSLRLRRAGWSLYLLLDRRVVHHYEFLRSAEKWYFLERNRHWLLAAHFRRRTLAVLALPLAMVEATTWLVAVQRRWVPQKLRTYRYWLQPGKVAYLRRRRAAVRALSVVDDAGILATASGHLDDPQITSRLSETVFNPVSDLLWRLLRPLIRW